MRFSSEVQAILRTAQEYAAGADQALTTGHILLGMLTSTSRAGRVLTELRVDVDKVLNALGQVKRADRRLEESDELLGAIEGHMVEAANRSASPLVSSLHLLLAVTREKGSVAYKVCVFLGIPPVQVRTCAGAGRHQRGPRRRAIERQQASMLSSLAGRAWSPRRCTAGLLLAPGAPSRRPIRLRRRRRRRPPCCPTRAARVLPSPPPARHLAVRRRARACVPRRRPGQPGPRRRAAFCSHRAR
ncbi:MAG: Clp protease N-terminal domain-containing protein [Myxococcota bacterium]